MENASKALLIAAAVLIVILVIAFGMSIFNSAKNSGDAEGTATAISGGITSSTGKLKGTTPGTPAYEFNQEINKYLGKNKAPSVVKELGTNYGSKVKLTKANFTPGEGNDDSLYNIEVARYNDDGYIVEVNIYLQK